MSHEIVLKFWFEEAKEEQWFKKDPAFDKHIIEKFSAVHQVVASGADGWGSGPKESLARIIVLDQFSRNMFRDTKDAFLYDAKALEIAGSLVASGDDKLLSKTERRFAYMPYMHSESEAVHEEAVKLFTELGDDEALKYEHLHKRIIDRFGRYPHRNEILGRKSTPEEVSFLASEEHSSF